MAPGLLQPNGMGENPIIRIQGPDDEEILPTSPPASPPRVAYSPPSQERVAQVVKECEAIIRAQAKPNSNPVGLLLRKASKALYLDGTTESHKTIIPHALLAEVLTKERISLSLCLGKRARQDYSPAECVRLIRGGGGSDELGEFARVFAVLLLCGRPNDIFRFFDNKLNDKAFPFVEGEDDDSIRSRDWDKSIPDCELGWPPDCRDSFLNSQWRVFLPCFKNEHQTFTKSTMMPWHNYHTPRATGSMASSSSTSTNGETDAPGGGHSDVFRVCIHEGHYRFDGLNAATGSPVTFAVKKLKTKKEADFHREVTMLRELSGKKPHIVRLLTTFHYDGSYCLLFPWAECDLLDYWGRGRGHEISQSLIIWVANQCHGLFQALKWIHKPGNDVLDPEMNQLYGRHGDIKPENILWYKGNSNLGHPLASGQLVFSDFGLSSLNHKNSRSGVDNKDILHTLAYAPPESILPGDHISRSIDIWASGCVFLEFVTWVVGGPALRDDFQRKRFAPHLGHNIRNDIFWEVQTFKDPKKGGLEEHVTVVKPSVMNWIATLRARPEATQFIQDFLDIIQDHMLIIEKSARGTAKRIAPLFDEMKRKCDKDRSYYTVPAPPSGSLAIPEQRPVVEPLSIEALRHISQATLNIPRYTGRRSPERKTREWDGHIL
ncbi:kinase-like protein [Canariomyces notabilis]|uniref:Kinase-like protein n=1 Tax=Canariomyces notabilis TaxID=2074819 RepID=A0AAN6QPX7_9PEZI|nr:kinase-like protein [Canariomyces arenarius]